MTHRTTDYAAPQGYSFDHARGMHVFAYREKVPSWYGLKNPASSPKVLVGFIGGGFLVGLALGAAIGGGVAFLLGLLGAGGGFIGYQKRYPDNTAKAKLTGNPDGRGVVTNFQVELHVSPDGKSALFREWYAKDPKDKKPYYGYSFPLDAVASVERDSYQHLFPDEYAIFEADRYETDEGKKKAMSMRGELRHAEMVTIVLANGEKVQAGHQISNNKAAVVQTDLIQFFNDCRQHLTGEQAQAARAAAFDPEDEAL